MRTAKTDQTGRMPRLVWVFAGRTLILLVLSCRGSYCVTDIHNLFVQYFQIENLCELKEILKHDIAIKY